MQDNNNINKSLKAIILIMSTLIVTILILLAVVLLKRKTIPAISTKANTRANALKTINLQEGLPLNCKPYEVIFKANYIAVYSKKCNIVKTFRTP